ncbi:MAG: glycosyltransferase family 4 protein [Candidatus Acidiferrales bacterium]
MTLSLATGLAEWARAHQGESIEVTFVTRTPANGMDDSKFPFPVVRRPSIPELIRLFRSADVINLAGPAVVPLTLSWILRKPTVLDHHGYQSVCPNGILVYGPDRSICPGHFMAKRYGKCIQCNRREMGLVGSIRNLLLTLPRRWLSKRVTTNVGVSPHVSRRVNLPRTTTIWNGVPDLTNGRDIAFDLPICFGYLGRLVTDKGLPVLLRAGRELASKGYDFRVRIVGDGPERGNLENMAQALGLLDRTEFIGSVPATGIQQTLQGVTVMVMPSVCEDVAPLAAMEQMMEGRLLIASNIGGLGIIANGGGLTFPVGDAGGLAARMQQVLDDPSCAAVLGKRARQLALETFTQDRMVAEHVRLYRNVMGAAT